VNKSVYIIEVKKVIMANHYFKEGDSYFKLVDETNEVICITTNWTNKCAAMSVDNGGGYESMRDIWLSQPEGIEIITEELYEAKRAEVRDYIIENL